MPDSAGVSGPCHHAPEEAFLGADRTRGLGQDSWMDERGDGDGSAGERLVHTASTQVLTTQVHATQVHTTRVHGEHRQFVTVVAVDKGGEEAPSPPRPDDLTTCHASWGATQPVAPQPAPRGFVTVVAVGSSSDAASLRLHQSDDGAIDAHLNVRLAPPDAAHADYVNQEMIERELDGRERQSRAAAGEGAALSMVPDQVVVYRLPGERLGLGLKFDGGMGARECVRRLFIQSVAPDSPAARAAVPWGELQPGDQILNIEGNPVSSMTRVQCVSFLKDAAMKITIGVLKGRGHLPEFENLNSEANFACRKEDEEEEAEDDDDSAHPPPLIVGEMRKRVPPPPLPPRSRPRKSPARPPKEAPPVPPPPSGFQDLEGGRLAAKHSRVVYEGPDDPEEKDQALQGWRDVILSQRRRPGDLEELLEDLEFSIPVTWDTRRLKESVDGDMPPRPAFYLDLVGEEDAVGPCESESDETNSSVSTVIDRLSLSSSTTVSRNSSFNTPADVSRFDLARALSPFEQLEKELETENRPEPQQQQPVAPTTAPRDETVSAPPIDRTTKPASAAAEAPSTPELQGASETKEKTSTPPQKSKLRPSIKAFSFSLKGRPFSWHQGKTSSERDNRAAGRSEPFLSLKRSGKRPAPPPPPRSVDSGSSATASSPVVSASSSPEAASKEPQSEEEDSDDELDSDSDDSDNYIDLVAEAANQGTDDEPDAPFSISCDKRETIKRASSDASAAAQPTEPNLSPEYLLILDSPAGDDVLDEFPDDSSPTVVKGTAEDVSEGEKSTICEAKNEMCKSQEQDYIELISLSPQGQVKLVGDLGVSEVLRVRGTPHTSATSEGASDVDGDYLKEVRGSGISGETRRQESGKGEQDTCVSKVSLTQRESVDTALSSNVGAQSVSSKSEENIEHHKSEMDATASETFLGQGSAKPASQVPAVKEVGVSEVAAGAGGSKGSAAKIEAEESEKGEGSFGGEEVVPSDMQDSLGTTETIYELEDDDGYSYVTDNGSELSGCSSEGFLTCSSPRVTTSELPSSDGPPSELSEDDDAGLYEDLYTDCYAVEDALEAARAMTPSLGRSLMPESRMLPSVPEEESGEQDSPSEDPDSLYDDVASEIKDDDHKAVDPQSVSEEVGALTEAPSGEGQVGDRARPSKTITQCFKAKRLRQDLSDIIRKELRLEGDVSVEVEEEEEVESLVECDNEEELLLVMRALRQDQPGDQLRWLEDESDEDDAAGGASGGGFPEGGGEAGEGGRDPPGPGEREDPPGTAEDPPPPSSAPGGQRALEDTAAAVAAAARALNGVGPRVAGAGSSPGLAPPSPAAAQSPAASTLARHSLPRGTNRHPRPPCLAAPRHLRSRPRHARDARDAHGVECRDSAIIPLCEEAQFEYEEEGSYEEILEVSEDERESPERVTSAARVCHDKALVPVTERHASQADGASDSALDRDDEAMVARTPPASQSGKALATCPDELQALSALTLQVKEASADPSGALRQPPPTAGAKEGTQPTLEGDAPPSANLPSAPPEGGGEGERQEHSEEGTAENAAEDAAEDAAEEPDFSTHPQYTEQLDNRDNELEELPTDGSSVRAEPIVAVVVDSGSQSEDEDEEGSQDGLRSDTGGGGNVSVSACEHRYTSTSGGAPPPYSRLPPDGHEFPSSYAEGLPDKLSRFARYSRLAMELDSPTSPGSPPPSSTSTPRPRSAPGTPLGPPPPIPRTSSSSSSSSSKAYAAERGTDGGSKWSLYSGGEERRSREATPTRGRWRRQDERSERSVRDKIAMFSTDGPDQPHPKTRKLDKVEGDEATMKRAFTEDDVRLDSSAASPSGKAGLRESSRSLSKTSAFSSMINVSTAEPKDSVKMATASSEVDIRQELPPAPRRADLRESKRAEGDSSSSGLHARSQSLIDIGRTSLTKRHSVGAYDRPSVYQYGVEKPEDRERRTSLSNLIEQRRKSLSKLRGLVIPESRANEGLEKTPIDLPKIASIPPASALKTMSLPREGQRSPRLYKADSISSIDSCESNTSRQSSLNAPPWKSSGGGGGGTTSGTSTLPKYSPAFKRKNIAVFNKCDNLPPPSGRTHSTRSASPTSDFSQASPVPPATTPPKSLESITTPSSEHAFEFCETKYSSDRHNYSKLSLSQKSSLDSRLSRAEDSDNDSAVSSTQSSFSQGISPPSSPMPEQEDHDDRSSRTYRSRLSPQSSFDEQDSARRVLKRGSIEAENRRNVLNSARCSSGRSSDEQLTPEIIRKFSSERVEETDRFPKRLDTELREGPKTTGLRRQPSSSSTSSAASSRRSSHDSSRRNSRDSVIHVAKHEEVKVSAEPVYFDQEGEMYKESQLKVAYLNEIMDDFEQLTEAANEEVIAEIPMSASRRVIEQPEAPENPRTSPTRRSERWAALEMKYGSSNTNNDIETKIQRLRRTSDASSPERTKKKSQGFRALADKWQQRAEEDTAAPQPQLTRRESGSRMDMPSRPNRLYDERASSQEHPTRPSRLCDDHSEADSSRPARPTSLYSESNLSSSNSSSASEVRGGRVDLPDRKLSMPEYGSGGIKMRERREGSNGGAPSRPTSLIEGGDAAMMDSHYLSAAPLSPAASTDSREDLLDTPEILSRTASKEVLDAFSRPKVSAAGVSLQRAGASNTPKMADIMRAFERHDLGKRGAPASGASHPRMSSLDSTNSDDGSMGAHYGSVTSLASGQRDQYGSITSLASSTSLISPQELAQLIEEANQSLEESGTPSHEILVVVLHREIVGHGSIGITLAGGADYEAKEITVHKVIPGSLADRDGRIQRGDRVLSINGKNLRGVTHREALSILKSPRPEVVLVLSRSRSVTPQESSLSESDGAFSHRPALINHVTSPRPPKILESPMDSKSLVSDTDSTLVPRGPPLTITLVKDGAGLGFSLEGGKDSPLGDRPLTVKKVFSGGAADKGGILKVGDELVSVNTVDVTSMARIEAWNFLKKLPDGTVSLVLRQKVEEPQLKSEE